ncbi:MAG: hypothetical protein ACFB0C_10725 [Leptolyngbyaceae cyanobacterium]
MPDWLWAVLIGGCVGVVAGLLGMPMFVAHGLCFLVYPLLMNWWSNRKRKAYFHLPYNPKNKAPRGKPRIPPDLAKELLALTRDPHTANRLVSKIARDHPGMSPGWCAEKAISDLLRDRRR